MTLKPEKRLDKNGRLVTRHVRVTTGKSVASGLPSPRLSEIDPKYSPMTTASQLRLYELLDEESQWVSGSDRQIKAVNELKDSIAALTPEVVETATSILAQYPHSRRVRTSVKAVLEKVQYYDDINEMNLHLPFAVPEVHLDSTELQLPYSHFQNRRLATEYILDRDGKDIFDDTPDEEQLKQAVALSHFLVAAGKKHFVDTSSFLGVAQLMQKHDEAMQLFISNPDRAEELGTLVIKRGADAGLIREFLGQHLSLNEGVL